MSITLPQNLPVPVQDPIATPRNWKKYPDPTLTDPNENRLTTAYFNYFNSLGTRTENSPNFPTPIISNTNQSASIAATSIAGALAGGVYRLSFAARIVVAASISSSLTVTFLWTDGSLTQSVSSSAITGNTTTTHASLSYMVHIDGGTPITYSTTYVSVGTAMEYDLYVLAESVNG